MAVWLTPRLARFSDVPYGNFPLRRTIPGQARLVPPHIKKTFVAQQEEMTSYLLACHCSYFFSNLVKLPSLRMLSRAAFMRSIMASGTEGLQAR